MSIITTFAARCAAIVVVLGWLAPPAAAAPPRERLSDTGLHQPGTKATRADLMAFSPQYPLWSDGATKRRWLSLPRGTAIDARDPDAWVFPRGTRLWKEFTVGRAIETRMIERLADGSWRYATYVWNEAGTEARLAPAAGIRALPVAGAPGGRYEIPGEADCRACHEAARVPVLGFSALQLSPDRDPGAPHAEPAGDWNLPRLVRAGRVKNLPPQFLQSPPRIVADTPTARAAQGYLHANCGHCHHDAGPLASLDLALAQPAAGRGEALASLARAGRYRTPGGAAGPEARATVLLARLGSRNPLTQMPPLGTRAIDGDAVRLVEAWLAEARLSHPHAKESSP